MRSAPGRERKMFFPTCIPRRTHTYQPSSLGNCGPDSRRSFKPQRREATPCLPMYHLRTAECVRLGVRKILKPFRSHSRPAGKLLSNNYIMSPAGRTSSVSSTPTSGVDGKPALIRKAGLRVTKPRLALLDALAAAGVPLSIEQLHTSVGADTCDLVTVYRCMGAFERAGVVARSYFHDGTTLFRLVEGEKDRYAYHVLCKSTNSVSPLDAQSSAKVKHVVQQVENALREQGYRDVGHIVEFFGTKA